MSDVSIRIELAGRAYPLTVEPGEEVVIRQVVDEINESMARLKAQYPVTDRQDLLAMAALEVTTRAMNTARSRSVEDDEAVRAEIERLLKDLGT